MSKLRDLLSGGSGGSGETVSNVQRPAFLQPAKPAPQPAPQPAQPNALSSLLNKPVAPADAIEHHAPPAEQQPLPSSPDDLGSLDIQLTTDVTGWPDQNATAIDPSLPEDAQQLKRMLADLGAKLGGSEVSDAMINVYKFLGENPHLKDVLLPQDIQICVRALQESTNTTIAKKQEGRAKRSKKATVDAAIANDLADIGFGELSF